MLRPLIAAGLFAAPLISAGATSELGPLEAVQTGAAKAPERRDGRSVRVNVRSS